MSLILDGTGGVTYPNGGSAQINPWVGPRAQIFTNSGTFTVPAGVTSLKVTVVGGGGSGYGYIGASNMGTGGAGGGAAIKWISGLTPGATISVTVGSGGAVQNSVNTNGNAGGSSSFGSYASATGGGGGVTWPGTNAGSIGGSGVGDITFTGSGSSGGVPSLGPNLASGGGASIFGGNNAFVGGNNTANNAPAYGAIGNGTTYGAGGAPAGGSGSSSAGYQGVVIVEY